MDDAMIELLADDGMLRGRIDAFADARLSPDSAAVARMRARILAGAHRRSATLRGDATLALLPEPAVLDGWTRPGRRRDASGGGRGGSTWRRAAAVVLAASLGLSATAGTALAARPGGALYGARVWAETLTLPADPSERAIAELARLAERLQEALAASAAGDQAGAEAALAAYELIVTEATDHALATGDPVAAAALEAGVKHNVEVLQGLLDRVPAHAAAVIRDNIARAIERSEDAVRSIRPGDPNSGPGKNAGGGDDPEPTASPEPTATPKPTREPKPTTEPKPDATERPTKEPPTPGDGGGSRPTPDPGATERPGPPDDPGGGPGGSEERGQGD